MHIHFSRFDHVHPISNSAMHPFAPRFTRHGALLRRVGSSPLHRLALPGNAGLLAQDRLIAIFEEALRQTRRAALFDTVRRNQAIGEELLSASEIQAEIVAARRARLA